MNEQACTTILVGKKATIDGSTMIARNDDTFLPLTPQRFIMQKAVHGRHEMWRSTQNGFEAPLPADGYRTTMTPNVDVKGLGYFGESSINEKKCCNVSDRVCLWQPASSSPRSFCRKWSSGGFFTINGRTIYHFS